MKPIEIEDFEKDYDEKVNKSIDEYDEMIDNAKLVYIPYAADKRDCHRWAFNIMDTSASADVFSEKLANKTLLEEDLLGMRSQDEDIRKFYKEKSGHECFRHKTIREKTIRKIMYEDAKRNVLHFLAKDGVDVSEINLDDANQLKEQWLNAKIQIRNDATTLMDSILTLQCINNVISCRNNIC